MNVYKTKLLEENLRVTLDTDNEWKPAKMVYGELLVYTSNQNQSIEERNLKSKGKDFCRPLSLQLSQWLPRSIK